MSKLLKIGGVFCAAIAVLLAVVFFWLDPNVFKPQIQAIAKEQGIDLSIRGDISWQFWPSIGFEINDISLAPIHTPSETLATLTQASLLVATGPLLAGEIAVHHLTIDGASVNFVTNTEGVSNWGQFLSPDTGKQKSPDENLKASSTDGPADGAEDLQLLISAMSISNAVISIVDEAIEQKILITVDDLQIDDVNTAGRPISINAAWAVGLQEAEAQALNLSGQADAMLTLGEALSALSATVLLDMTINGEQRQETFSGELTLQAKDLKAVPSFNGQWVMKPVNIKNLLASLGLDAPQTKNPEALKKVSMDVGFKGTDTTITIAPILIALDKTSITGSIEITDIQHGTTVIKLAGNRMNIDDYLPPAVASEANEVITEAAGEQAAGNTAAAPLIPLDVIKDLDLMATFDWQEAIVANLTLRNLQLKLVAENAIVSLQNVSLDAYQGHVALTGQLNAKGSTALIDFKADMQNIQLAPLLKDLALDEDAQLTGALNLKATGRTQGITEPELMDALVAEARFDGAKVKFSPLNVEQKFCQLVSLLSEEDKTAQNKEHNTEEGTQTNSEESIAQQNSADKIWPEFTNMRELNGLVNIKNQIITLESFNAGVAHLGLTTLGTVDLKKDKYDMYLPFKLFEKNTSELGCTVKSNYWLNRSLSLLRCHGSLANLSPASDCGFDEKALGSLTTDYAAYRLKKKLVKELGGKNEDGSQSLESQAVETLFDLFTKKK